MQENDHMIKFEKLPTQLKKLVPKPQFKQVNLSNLSIKQIPSLLSRIKTQTLLSLLNPPRIFVTPPILTAPIILIFCQPSQQLSLTQIYPYSPISYSSWLQSVGARCIPIPYNCNQGTIQFLLERTNGLLIPGGGSNLYKLFQTKEGFGQVTQGFHKIYRAIHKMWTKGVYYPIWGTCLGLELVVMAITMDTKILSDLNSRGHQTEIYSDYRNSTILQDLPTNLKIQLENRKLLNFAHVYGISVQKYLSNQKLNEKLKVISISKDKSDKWFCSMFEGRNNPIFLSQFHPEKQAYQWTLKGDILHEKYAVALSQWMAHSFIKECLKCKPSKQFVSTKQQNFYLMQQYIQHHTPLKMYKIYIISHKYRYVDKQARKQLKNQRSQTSSKIISSKSISTNKSIKSPFI